jgi:hypothetical protein
MTRHKLVISLWILLSTILPGVKKLFKKSILIPLRGGGLDQYRTEYNKVLLDEATGANGFIQMKYITMSVFKKSPAINVF